MKIRNFYYGVYVSCVVLFACGLESAAAQVPAQALAETVAKQLREMPVVRASFIQTKQIAALKRPVVSRGYFVFSRERGIVWAIQQPIAITYLLQPNGVTEVSAEGHARRQSGREAQGMMEVGRILNALWSGNTTALEPLFQTEMQGKPEQWNLKLLPRNAPLSDFLTSIEVNGSAARIQHVTLVEFNKNNKGNQDRLTIDFQAEAQPAALSLQELHLFDVRP